jgi:Skp family chaperone for outer membrane proteins
MIGLCRQILHRPFRVALLLGVALGSGAAAQGLRDDLLQGLPLSTGRAAGDVQSSVPMTFPQGAAQGLISPILTIDWDGLYQRSAWGLRVAREIATAGGDLNTENTRVADQLTAEEKDLTERRPGMAPVDFRAAADAFDARVVAIRRAQEAKSRAIAAQADEERRAFISAALPLLDAVLAERGATAVIDARVIIRSLGAVDVTEDMVTFADDRLGDGKGRVEAARAAAASAGVSPSADPSSAAADATLVPNDAPADASGATRGTTP